MQPLTKNEIRFLDENAILIEKFIKKRALAACDQCGPEMAVNVLLNSGITTITAGLSTIADDAQRLATTINTFVAIAHELNLQMVESEAQSIIKKAMQK